MSEVVCVSCGVHRASPAAKSGKPRTPRGWKQIHDRTYCPKCKTANYVLRAISIPVAKCDWNVVNPALRAAQYDCVRCSNWLLTQYYQRDSLVTEAGAKLPPWNIPYLYPDARVMFPAIEATTLVSLINSVSRRYRAARFDIWRGTATLPVQRESPLPIIGRAWKLSEENGTWVFNLRMGSVRHDLVLSGGGQFHRQHRSLAQIVSGDIEAGEAALYRKDKALMLKIAGWFPRGTIAGAERTISARTCIDGFLIAVDGESIWRLNADHVQRWIVGASVQQQRLREDLKAERRFPRPMRKGITDRMAELSGRRKNRMNSWMHEASAQLVNWTKRRKGGRLIWDDSYPSMFASFPWFMFAARIEQKCEIEGIEFVRASEHVADKTGQAF